LLLKEAKFASTHWHFDLFGKPAAEDDMDDMIITRLKKGRWLNDTDINVMLRILEQAKQEPSPNFTLIPSQDAQLFNATNSKKIFNTRTIANEDVIQMNINISKRPWFCRVVGLLKQKRNGVIINNGERFAKIAMPVVFANHWTVAVFTIEVGKPISITILDSYCRTAVTGKDASKHSAYFFAQHFALHLSQQLPLCSDPREFYLPVPKNEVFATKVQSGYVAQPTDDMVNCGIAAVMAIYEQFFTESRTSTKGESFLAPNTSLNDNQKTTLAHLLKLEQLRNRWVEDLSGKANYFIRLVKDINGKRPRIYIYFNY
jgi:hypothetical protein